MLLSTDPCFPHLWQWMWHTRRTNIEICPLEIGYKMHKTVYHHHIPWLHLVQKLYRVGLQTSQENKGKSSKSLNPLKLIVLWTTAIDLTSSYMLYINIYLFGNILHSMHAWIQNGCRIECKWTLGYNWALQTDFNFWACGSSASLFIAATFFPPSLQLLSQK